MSSSITLWWEVAVEEHALHPPVILGRTWAELKLKSVFHMENLISQLCFKLLMT